MSIEKDILKILLERDIVDDRQGPVRGIAQLAVDKGYETLSAKQKGVLRPYLSTTCSGMVGPSGTHNECRTVLEGNELLEAYGLSDEPLCESCMGEQAYFQHKWDQIREE